MMANVSSMLRNSIVIYAAPGPAPSSPASSQLSPQLTVQLWVRARLEGRISVGGSQI